MPETGGGCTTRISPSWMPDRRFNSSPVMPAADSFGSRARSAQSSRIRNTAPEFGALVNVAPLNPTMLTAWAIPGVCRQISTTRRWTSSVRAKDAPGGNCSTPIK